jgi:hypothetical protein
MPATVRLECEVRVGCKPIVDEAHEPGQPKDRSIIRFSDVALYHFIHTSGAILIDIGEIPVATLLEEIASDLSDWDRMYGLRWRRASKEDCVADRQAGGLKAWKIDSAMGFGGFVIARMAE